MKHDKPFLKESVSAENAQNKQNPEDPKFDSWWRDFSLEFSKFFKKIKHLNQK